MRKLNAILAGVTMILFVIHMIWGALVLCGMTDGGSFLFTCITHLMTAAALTHMTVSLILTIQTVLALAKSGVSYFRLNKLFWIRRLSGFALIIFILLHVMIFRGDAGDSVFRLNMFGNMQLIVSILMVISLLVHLLCNIEPLRISLGIDDRKRFRIDILLVLSVLLLLSGAAFAVYYIRWRIF